MQSLLRQLHSHSVIVADTGNLAAIQAFKPEDATTNPSLILQSFRDEIYIPLINDAVSYAVESGGNIDNQVENCADYLTVAIGTKILESIPGRVSTEVDAHLSYNTNATIEKARKLIKLYEQQDIEPSRVLIKIAATWEGIQAAKVLEQEGINCNLTLIFSFAQARACAEAGAFLISPFVGRILDWYKKAYPERQFNPESEPGVTMVSEVYRWLKQHQYKTIVMAASFRNSGEITALAGCDRLTISPALLEELDTTEGVLEKHLSPPVNTLMRLPALEEAEFRWQLNDDPMATEKLAEGIRRFAQDQRTLFSELKIRLQEKH